ncbi:c-type cytochrome [Halomonas beimenensis]|uniref:Nitric oxide reductase subunit C n=1 Tax=Halomonas beimenensis TaxID=475662 RepID=A0A291PCG0_9GAMM|nr:cytochrome c [Halomonas beimenensis]ATJ84577.1 nitric oxide reductase subunit C [Halomonas beimenensis]
MAEGLTKSAARNIFYGGSLFFFLLFAALTAHSHWYMVSESTDQAGLSESVKHGKEVWEENMCINCHSIMGEGAYFAPELANVWTRYGGRENPEAARAGLAAWMRAQPLGAPGRRQMPQFDLDDEEMDALIDFLQWTDGIDDQDWPPHPAG